MIELWIYSLRTMLLRVASLPLIGLRHLDNVTRCLLPDLTFGSKKDLSALWDTPSDTLAAGLSHLLSLSLRIRMPLGSRNHLYVFFFLFSNWLGGLLHFESFSVCSALWKALDE